MMKIFMGNDGLSNSISVRIVHEGKFIVLQGIPCNDCRPIYGCELDDGESARLKEWINRNDQLRQET
jgi:hypothetical protein